MTKEEFKNALDYLHIMHIFDEKQKLYTIFVDDIAYYMGMDLVTEFQDHMEVQTYIAKTVISDYMAGKIGKEITVH